METPDVMSSSTNSSIPRSSRLPVPRSSIPLPSSRSGSIPRPKAPETKTPIPTRLTHSGNNGLLRPASRSNLVPRNQTRPKVQSSEATFDQVSTEPEPQEPKTPRSRMSLAERTVESIGLLPSTPSNGRRKSDFFSAESPMAPRSQSRNTSRPQSSAGSRNTNGARDGISPAPPVPSINAALRSGKLHAKLSASTSTRPSVSSKPVVSKQGNISSSKPASRPPAPSTRPTPSNPKPTTPRAPLKPSTPNLVRTAEKSKNRKPFQSSNVSRDQGKPDKEERISDPTKSSAALREQIRQAKAARKSTGVQNAPSSYPAPEFDVGVHDDPFNQGLKGGALVMRKRVDTARTEGKLNISILGLKEIPEEVMKMYDYEYNKDQSEIAWGQVVDLTRFIAADNELASLPDDCFPDVKANTEMYDENDDSNPSPFAGIEHLDLHGNILSVIPTGLRQLERLTFLNLSRNRLTNEAFDIISQIPCLVELQMTDNALWGELNPAVGNLASLEILNLQSNELTGIPASLRSLTKLRVLDLSHNSLTSISPEALTGPPLTIIRLSKNNLQGVLFSERAELSHVQVLDVSINGLTSLATDMSLPALHELNISFNRMTSLPDMATWTELISLYAESNSLSDFSDSIYGLEKLKILDFTGNDVPRLDPRFSRMVSLEVLKFAANPMRERKFLSMSTSEVLRDLRARLGTDEAGDDLD